MNVLLTVSQAQNNIRLDKHFNEYLLTYRYRKLVDPFFAEGNSVYWVPEGLNLIQSEAYCGIRAKRGEARRSEVSNSCQKGPKKLNFHQEELDQPV